MKNIFVVLLLCLFSMGVSAQKRTTTRTKVKQPTTLVTKSMADKIAEPCLNRIGYCPTIFFDSNKEFLSVSDILQGKAVGHCINIQSIRRTLFMPYIDNGDMMV